MNDLEFLIKIAENSSLYGKAFISTSAFAKEFELSQQSVSRKLIELEKEGVISRKPGTRGIQIEITEKGISLLKEKYSEIKKLFEQKTAELQGTLISGL